MTYRHLDTEIHLSNVWLPSFCIQVNNLHETKLLKIIPGAGQLNLCYICTLYRALLSTVLVLSTARKPQEHVVVCLAAHRTCFSTRLYYTFLHLCLKMRNKVIFYVIEGQRIGHPTSITLRALGIR